MADPGFLIADRLFREEEEDPNPILVVSSVAYRNNLVDPVPSMRVWAVLENSRTTYTGTDWVNATLVWDRKNRFIYELGDMTATGPGSVKEFLASMGLGYWLSISSGLQIIR